MPTPTTSRSRNGFLVRMPDDVKQWLYIRAQKNLRSQHSELLVVLLAAMERDRDRMQRDREAHGDAG